MTNCYAGLYGMKPTSRRLPMGGLSATMLSAEHIIPAIGPISTSLQGCKLFIKSLIDNKPWCKEPSLLPFPWRSEDFFNGKKLKIGVLWDDGVVKPHPPVTRAMNQIVERLKANGNVEVVEWKPFQHDTAWEILVSANYLSNGVPDKHRQVSISSMVEQKKLLQPIAHLSHFDL